MQIQSLGREDPLEEEMATHPSILAWTVLWAEKQGRLQSTASQRVGQDVATLHAPTHLCFTGVVLWQQQ